ncbi:hypothetical protein PO909_002430, partial [Leuciscus waleckii]
VFTPLLSFNSLHCDVPKPTLTVRPQSSVFTGDSVTLRCELDQSWDGWGGREFLWSKDSNTESPEAETKTINPVKVSDGGEYKCRARRGGNYTDYSEPVAVIILVTVTPDHHHVYRGETVTLRCDIYDGGVTSWRYNWYKDGSTYVFSERQQHTFSSVSESDAGKYSCNGTETEGSHWSQHSDEVTLTVSGEFDHLFINTHKFNMLLMICFSTLRFLNQNYLT